MTEVSARLAMVLGLSPGEYLVVNCGARASDSGCQLVFMAPADQRDDMLEALVDHAVRVHGHAADSELHDLLDGAIVTVIV